MMSMSSIAHAVPVNGLRDPAFRYIYGSYAPGGDCSREPRVTINSAGMTFRASGRDVKTTRLEYAASIFGVRYEGITLAFYPFVKSDNTLGPRSEEHTSELQSLMRISYAVFCLTKKKLKQPSIHNQMR